MRKALSAVAALLCACGGSSAPSSPPQPGFAAISGAFSMTVPIGTQLSAPNGVYVPLVDGGYDAVSVSMALAINSDPTQLGDNLSVVVALSGAAPPQAGTFDAANSPAASAEFFVVTGDNPNWTRWWQGFSATEQSGTVGGRFTLTITSVGPETIIDGGPTSWLGMHGEYSSTLPAPQGESDPVILNIAF